MTAESTTRRGRRDFAWSRLEPWITFICNQLVLSPSKTGIVCLAFVVASLFVAKAQAQVAASTPYANLCTDLGVTLPTLNPVPDPNAGGLTGLLSPVVGVVDGLTTSVNSNVVTPLNGARLSLSALSSNVTATAALSGGNCNIATGNLTTGTLTASNVVINGSNGITIGGGQINGLGAGASAFAGDTTAIAFGNGASTASGSMNAIAIGQSASTTGAGALALGATASASVAGGVALGAGSTANRGAITTVADPTALTANPTTVTTITGAASIGTAASPRQLIDVAAGTSPTDAVNVGQITPITAAVNAQAVNAVTNGTSVAAALGGGATYNAMTGAISPPTYSVGGGTYMGIAAAIGAQNAISETAGTGLTAALGGGSSYNPGTGAVTGPSYTVDGASYTTVGAALSATNAGLAVHYSSAGMPTVPGNGAPSQDVTLVGAASGSPVGLHNLADGSLSASSTDAVNGSQLNGAGASLAATLGGGSSFNTATGVVSAPAYTVGGATYNTVGAALTAQGGISAAAGTSLAATLGGNATYNGATGTVSTPTYTVDGATYTTVGAAISAAAAGSGGPVQYSTAPAPTTANSGVVSDNLTLVGAGAGQAVTLHNLAAGSLAGNSTDAVNGSQLNSAGVSVATSLGGGSSFNTATGVVSAPAYTVGGATYNTVGAALTAQGGISAAAGTSLAATLGGNASYNAATGTVSTPTYTVDGATYTTVGAAISAAAAGSGGPVQYSTAPAPTTANSGVVSDNVTLVGAGAGQAVTLHNLAAGSLAGNSTDAVNGSQLNSAGVSVASSLGGGSSFNTATGVVSAPAYTVGGMTYTDVGSALAAQGGLSASSGYSVAAAFGGTATYNPSTGAVSAPNYVVGGVTYSNVGAAITALANASGSPNSQAAVTIQKYFHANSTGTDSIASGINAVAIGVSDTAIGTGALSSGSNATAFNTNATALGANASAGSMANGTSDTDNTAVGANSTAVGVQATAIGSHSMAMGQAAVALGSSTTAMAASTAIGTNATTMATDSIAIGMAAHAGDGSQAERSQAGIAIGTIALAMGNGTAIGNASVAQGESATAVGQSANAQGVASTAIGLGSMAGSDNAVAIGSSATATGGSSVSVGYQNSASGNGAVAVGDPDIAAGAGATAVGENDTATGQGAVAIGNGDTATGQGAVALGNASNAASAGALAFGDGAAATLQNDAAFGAGSSASGGSSVALGAGAIATNAFGVALGAGSIDGANANTAGTILAGPAVSLTFNNLGNPVAGSISVGSTGAYRQIQNVADGSSAHDAVTVEQLASVVGQTNAAIALTDQNVASLGSLAAANSGQPGTSGGALQYSTAAAPTTPSQGPSNDATLVGASAEPVGLHNLAAGAVTAASTDAVNGAQLFTTNDEIASLATKESGLAVNTALAPAAASGAETAAVGGGAQATAVGGVAVGSGATSTGANSVALGAGSTDGGQSGVVSVGAAGAERKIINVAPGAVTAFSTDAVNGSQLYTVSQEAQNAVQYGVNPSGARTNTVTLTGGNREAPVTVTNVAAGAVTAGSSDAVNGSQLYGVSQAAATAETTATSALTMAQSSVQYDDGTHSSVTVSPGGPAATLHNVAAGTAPTDAANVGQVDAAMNNAVVASNAYTDSRINQVMSEVLKVRQNADAATAGAMAAAGIPQAHTSGKTMLAMAAGTWEGQSAYAIGFSRMSENEKWIVKASVNYNTQGQGGVNVGVGFEF